MIMKIIYVPAFLFLIALWLPAQETVEIGQIEELIASIRQNGGDILFAKKFYNFLPQYQRIKKTSDEGVLNPTEKSDLITLYRQFEEINQQTNKLRPYFSSVLESRANALAREANDFAPQLFTKAEQSLQEVAEKLVKNIPANSQELLNRCIHAYREAEFEAVRNKLLSEVRILLQESKELGAEKIAPKLNKKVNSLLTEVENILNAHRYNDPTLNQKAAQLLEESTHLLYVVQQQQQLRKENDAFETYLLSLESTLHRMADLLAIRLSFSEGLEPALKAVEMSIEELKSELQHQQQKNQQLQDTIYKLSEEIDSLKLRLIKNQLLSEKIESLKAKLAPLNVKVSFQENEITLRMNPVQFLSGRLTLPEDAQNQLKKVAEVLREYPIESVTIRLMQNPGGNLQYSQNLVKERAARIALFIQNSSYLADTQIRSEGWIKDKLPNNGSGIVEIILKLLIPFQ